MMRVSCSRAVCSAPLRPARLAPCKRSIGVKASDGGFDLDKVVADLPVPVEYAYAGVAWGARHVTFALPLSYAA